MVRPTGRKRSPGRPTTPPGTDLVGSAGSGVQVWEWMWCRQGFPWEEITPTGWRSPLVALMAGKKGVRHLIRGSTRTSGPYPCRSAVQGYESGDV